MNMKKIIALSGRSNTGKTQTLKLLMHKLDEFGECIERNENENTDRNRTYLYRGIKISICTGGDTDFIIESNIKYFEQTNCDIAITAVRTKGRTRTFLNKFADKNNLKVKYINKTIDGINADKINQKQVEELFEIIDTTIKALK